MYVCVYISHKYIYIYIWKKPFPILTLSWIVPLQEKGDLATGFGWSPQGSDYSGLRGCPPLSTPSHRQINLVTKVVIFLVSGFHRSNLCFNNLISKYQIETIAENFKKKIHLQPRTATENIHYSRGRKRKNFPFDSKLKIIIIIK